MSFCGFNAAWVLNARGVSYSFFFEEIPYQIGSLVSLNNIQGLFWYNIVFFQNLFSQELLNVIRETENDDLTDALQDLIKQYQDDPRLGQMAVIIAQHLVWKEISFL
jgi:hypothetical protein